jgi:hypothetical protein
VEVLWCGRLPGQEQRALMNKAEWAVVLILPVALVRHQIRGRSRRWAMHDAQ